MIPSRRKFERLEISEHAIALDETGRKLGTVSSAGGGGMTIALADDLVSDLPPGSRLRVIVEETSTGIRHTIPVEVKYYHQGALGVQFLTAL